MEIYDKYFYRQQRRENRRSAEALYPYINELILKNIDKPRVCDIGCGTGNWLKVFKEMGCEVVGFDRMPYEEELCIERAEFRK